MLYSKTTERGTIRLDREVLASILRRSAEPLSNKVIFSDSHGKIRKNAVKPGADSSFFSFIYNAEDETLNIEFYLIIHFGVSIKETAAEIAAQIRKDVPQITGLEVGTLKIVFMGVISKNLSKRRVEVVTNGGA